MEKPGEPKSLRYKRTMAINRYGIALDRVVGFQDLGGKDDFTTKALEALLIRKGMISESKRDEEDEEDVYHENKSRAVRSSAGFDSDSD